MIGAVQTHVKSFSLFCMKICISGHVEGSSPEEPVLKSHVSAYPCFKWTLLGNLVRLCCPLSSESLTEAVLDQLFICQKKPFIMSLDDDLVNLHNVCTNAFCPTHAFSLILLIDSTM